MLFVNFPKNILNAEGGYVKLIINKFCFSLLHRIAIINKTCNLNTKKTKKN